MLFFSHSYDIKYWSITTPLPWSILCSWIFFLLFNFMPHVEVIFVCFVLGSVWLERNGKLVTEMGRKHVSGGNWVCEKGKGGSRSFMVSFLLWARTEITIMHFFLIFNQWYIFSISSWFRINNCISFFYFQSISTSTTRLETVSNVAREWEKQWGDAKNLLN